MVNKLKYSTFLFASLVLSSAASSSQFQPAPTEQNFPFSITPSTIGGGGLPTQVIWGQSVKAYYTVTDTTGAPPPNSYVRYLPPNVEQVTADVTIPNLCGSTFSLAPYGYCILELVVSGAVDVNDPDYRHHLRVCMSDGITCAGTSPENSLNVNFLTSNLTELLYSVSNIPGGNDILTTCPVDSRAVLMSCTQTSQSTNVEAPFDIILNNSATLAYVFSSPSGSPFISVCPVNSANGSIGMDSCDATFDLPAGVVTGHSLRFNSQNTLLYVTAATTSAGVILTCPVNPDNSLSTCSTIYSVDRINFGGRVTFDRTENYAYVALATPAPPYNVLICSVSSVDGSFSQCVPHNDSEFVMPIGIDTNAAGTYLYVANANNTLAICPINSDASLGACDSSNGNGTFNFGVPVNLFMQDPNHVAYIPNQQSSSPSTISVCAIHFDGSLGLCALNEPENLEENPFSAWVSYFDPSSTTEHHQER